MKPDDLQPIPPQQREHRIACRYCGHLNPRSARKCEKCGAPIDLAAVAQSYIAPIAQRFGLLLFLAVPIVFICLAAVSFIAGGLGYGAAVRPIVNTLILVLGLAAFVIIGGTLVTLYLVYKRKTR